MKKADNTVRIISGLWRGRRIKFADAMGLRPTKDNIRETVFNWLAAVIHGSNCLDLFAGSGALGFEAASRGAAEVCMVEQSSKVVKCIKEQLDALKAEQVIVHNQTAEQFLVRQAKRFDVVFLDPPFNQGMLDNICRILLEKDLVKPNGYVYIEMSDQEPLPESIEQWQLLKEKKAGNVVYRLFRV